jgi:hypothetical protein
MLYEYVTLISLALVGVLTVFTIWSRVDIILRPLALIVFIISIFSIGSIGLLTLSHPIPYNILNRFEDKSHEVIAVMFDIDEAIYLWVNFDGYPRYIVLPWSDEKAKELQGYMDRREEFGTGFEMKFSGDEQESDDGIFHDKPQEQSPPKEVPEYEIYTTPQN